MSNAETLYEVVSDDEYELPEIVGTSLEVAEYMGIKVESLYAEMCKSKKGGRYRKVVIPAELN